jgi:hypothetical protein
MFGDGEFWVKNGDKRGTYIRASDVSIGADWAISALAFHVATV